MISVDITWSPNNELNYRNELCESGDPAFMKCHKLNMLDFGQLISYIIVINDQTWLHNAQVMARKTMKCEVDLLIAEVNQMLKEAKETIKKKHSFRYKLAFYKQILKNPALTLKSIALIWGPKKLKDRIICRISQ